MHRRCPITRSRMGIRVGMRIADRVNIPQGVLKQSQGSEKHFTQDILITETEVRRWSTRAKMLVCGKRDRWGESVELAPLYTPFL